MKLLLSLNIKHSELKKFLLSLKKKMSESKILLH
jgi:hypothetical protein